MLEKLDNLDQQLKAFSSEERAKQKPKSMSTLSLTKPRVCRFTGQTDQEISAAEKGVMDKLDVLEEKLSAFSIGTKAADTKLNSGKYRTTKLRPVKEDINCSDDLDVRKMILKKLSRLDHLKQMICD